MLAIANPCSLLIPLPLPWYPHMVSEQAVKHNLPFKTCSKVCRLLKVCTRPLVYGKLFQNPMLQTQRPSLNE